MASGKTNATLCAILLLLVGFGMYVTRQRPLNVGAPVLSVSDLHKLHGQKCSIQTWNYDIQKYDFPGVMRKIFGLDSKFDLGKLHTLHPVEKLEEGIGEVNTWYHKTYYGSPHLQEMLDLYHGFMREWGFTIYPDEDRLIVQCQPNIRFALPDNTAIGKLKAQEDERIGIHMDGAYNHPPQELNFLLAMTPMLGTNTIWFDSDPEHPDRKAWYPLTVWPGQVSTAKFNQCPHWNMYNRENYTRISYDYRVIPGSQYIERNISSHTYNVHFGLNGYYTLITRDQTESLRCKRFTPAKA